MEQETIDRRTHKELLHKKLQAFGIDVEDWGTGSAKTLEYLVEEIRSGETVLKEEENQLFRSVDVVAASVVYIPLRGRFFRLREAEQRFLDGRPRDRHQHWSLTEKIQGGEEPAEALYRGLREELGIGKPPEIEHLGKTVEWEESPSYPGLQTRYIIHQFLVRLANRHFRPQGYQEVRDGVRTVFVWEEVGKHVE